MAGSEEQDHPLIFYPRFLWQRLMRHTRYILQSKEYEVCCRQNKPDAVLQENARQLLFLLPLEKNLLATFSDRMIGHIKYKFAIELLLLKAISFSYCIIFLTIYFFNVSGGPK